MCGNTESRDVSSKLRPQLGTYKQPGGHWELIQIIEETRNETKVFVCEREEEVPANTMIRSGMKKYRNFLRQ